MNRNHQNSLKDIVLNAQWVSLSNYNTETYNYCYINICFEYYNIFNFYDFHSKEPLKYCHFQYTWLLPFKF